MKSWTLEKDLFGLYLANQGVKKLISDDGEVLLVAWNCVSGEKFFSLEFTSHREYEDWMDTVVSDYDAAHNRARALLCLIRSMGEAVGN